MTGSIPIRVALFAGGPSGEHDISLLSASAVSRALEPTRFSLVHVRIGHDRRWAFGVLPHEPVPASAWLTPGRGLAQLEQERVDVAMSTMHGPFGEDGTIQGALEVLGLPYVGSGVLASAVAMHKAFAKAVLRHAGVPVAPDVLLSRESWAIDAAGDRQRVQSTVGLPCFVKPAELGSSVGAGPAHTSAELDQRITSALAASPEALVEPLLAGRELTAPIVEEPTEGTPQALPLIEIRPIGHAFFDFTSKYTAGHNEEICPAPVPADVAVNVQAIALRAHAALGCRGLSRTDFILTDAGPIVLEVNTLPGLTDASLIRKAAAAAGWSFAELLERLVQRALASPSAPANQTS